MYFLAPARHSTPLGAIALGNIIKDPREPEIALNDTNSEAVKKLAAKAVAVDETNAFHYMTEGSNVRANVMARALESFGAGAGVHRSSDVTSLYKIDKMKTYSVSPSFGEVKEIFNEPAVQEGLRNSFFEANVFMITSIRVVYGAEVFASTIREAGGYLFMRADLTPTGAPVDLEAAAEAGKKRGEILTTHVSDQTPFVLAYRLREISFRRKQVKAQRDAEGDVLDAHEEEVAVLPKEDMSDYVADMTEFAEEDLDVPERLGIPTAVGEDVDGSEVQIAVPVGHLVQI